MKNRGLVATIVVMSGVIITLLVVLLVIKMPTMLDILNIKNKLINQTEATTETKVIVQTTEPTTEARKVTAKVTTYEGYNNHVSIEYPEISGMKDEEQQEKINHKLYMNALSIVPLYPISTAVQNLNIFCEIKYIGDDYITAIYTGSVVGNQVKDASSTSSGNYSGSSSTKKSSSGTSSSDQYLNGFVDPLAGSGVSSITPSSDLSSLPLPKTTTGTSVMGSSVPQADTYTSITQAAGVNIISADTNTPNGAAAVRNSTSDSGPTVTTITAPTAKAKSLYSENVAVNGPGLSNVPASNAPNSSTQGVNVGGTPVYSQAGTNNSASTIDQRIFYTNTIDLVHGTDIGIKDYGVSLDTLAKYIRSSDVVFENIDDSKRNEVRTYIKKTVQSKYVEQLNEADFRNTELKTWPKIFSYKDSDGVIHLSVKLSSKLGNYAIIKYKK